MQRQGITLDINGVKMTVYFALGLVLGDNLALKSALGYVSSFRANHFCRFCKASRVQTESDCKLRPELQRKSEHYMQDVVAKNSSITGITELSVWNEIDYFSVYSNYSSDELHDIKFGVLKYAMGQIVHQYVIIRQTFTLRTFNERIDCFKYRNNGFTNTHK